MTSEDLKILDTIENVRFDEKKKCVTIIDQTLLPNETRYIDLCTPEEIWEAIHELRVRGAVAIGICAAYGMYCLSLTLDTDNYGVFYEKMSEYGEYLNSSRPTAVNLSWALQRINQVIRNHPAQSVSDIRALIKAECISMQLEDVRICTAISEYGLSLLKDGDGVLTHCNAGPLASSKYGTAQGPFYMSRERGMTIHVFADETRPLLQGARLTSYELARAGVDVTLVCDNMASIVMKNGWIDACFVGCDRVAANGDAANKVGTSGVAILAKHYGIPFYVFCPLSTLDMNCASGNDIKIELRDEREIKEKYYEKPMALEEVKCYNPSFDVTDHELITAIVTEKGICYPPFTESLAKISQINL